MGDLADKIKSFIIAAATIIGIITVAILIFIGPKDAADFLKWIGEMGGDVGQSGKEFVNYMKN